MVFLYNLALSFMVGADVFTHFNYIEKDSYFKSISFKQDISSFYQNIKTYHVFYKNYEKKSPEDKITTQELNAEIEQQKQLVENKVAEIEQSYNFQINDANNAGNFELKNLLVEQRDKKIKEYREKSTKEVNEIKKDLVALRDKDYESIKRDLSDNSLKYYIQDVKTKEVFTNINNVSNIEEYIEAQSMYSLKFPKSNISDGYFNDMNYEFKQLGLEGYIIVPSNLNEYSQIYSDKMYYNSIRNRIIKEVYLLVVLITILLFLVYSMKKSKVVCGYVLNEILKRLEKFPLDLRLGGYFFTTIIFLIYSANISFFYKPITTRHFLKLTIGVIFLTIITLGIITIRELIKNKGSFKAQWSKGILFNFHKDIKACFIYKNISIKIIAVLFLTFVLGALFIAALSGAGDARFIFVVYFMFFIVVIPVYLVKKVSYMNRIIKGSEEIVSGNLDYEIEERTSGKLLDLSKNINNMKISFRNSLENQMKSERLKSELITNVSHDLKTPLTSIINYVDIIKRKRSLNEDLDDYIEILDRKAQRLKALIEDLFEVSKMASGTVELNLEKVDIGALLSQAVAELDDKIKNSSLTFKLNLPQQKIYANLDGKKIWRVFENLIGNAIKYSQPNTRVYMNLFEEENKVILIFKNIAAYEMDFDPEEIFERFKRGDKSRNTEGSGLGLAIAKSIIDLHGGDFRIHIDGDLFKAIIEFKK